MKVLSCFISILIFCKLLLSNTVEHEISNIRIDIPEDWNYEYIENNLILQNENIKINISSIDVESRDINYSTYIYILKGVLNKLADLSGETNIIKGPANVNINIYKGIETDIEGNNKYFKSFILHNPLSNEVINILVTLDKNDYTLYADDILNITNSILPIKILDLNEKNRIYNDIAGYSIILPENWKVDKVDNSIICSSYLIEHSNITTFNINISEDIQEDEIDRIDETLLEIFNDFVSGLGLYVETVNFETGEIRINNINMKWMSFLMRIEDMQLNCILYFYIKDNTGYLFSCAAKPVVFELFKKHCEEIIETFQLEELSVETAGEFSFSDEFNVTVETLWVQSENTWNGTPLGWNEDLSYWSAGITRGNLSQMESAIIAENFTSQWFSEGIIMKDAGILYDGTPLYFGANSPNDVFVGVGEQLIGPYKAGIGNFIVSPDRKHWAKVMGKENGFVLLFDGEEISEIYNGIYSVFFDSSSSFLYYRFENENQFGIARSDKGILFQCQWIGKQIFLKGEDVFCEIGRDGNYINGIYNGPEAIAKNGEPIYDWWNRLEIFGIKDGKPYYFFEDNNEDWCGFGEQHIGPYKTLFLLVNGLNNDFFYIAQEDIEGFSIYKNGENVLDKKWNLLTLLPNDSILNRSLSICSSGIGYLAVDNEDNYFIIFNEKKYGPYPLASPPVVSADGEHLAWVIKNPSNRNKSVVVVDGVMQSNSYDDIYFTKMRFTPDGKHLVYLAKNNSGVWLVVDDEPIGKPFANPDLTFGRGITFTDIYLTNEKLCIIGDYYNSITGVVLVRVTVDFF